MDYQLDEYFNRLLPRRRPQALSDEELDGLDPIIVDILSERVEFLLGHKTLLSEINRQAEAQKLSDLSRQLNKGIIRP